MWFWNKKNEQALQIKAVQELEETLLVQSKEQSQISNELVSKLTRMQYKNFQEIQHKLERMEKQLLGMNDWHESEAVRKQGANDQAWKMKTMAENMFRWLDDMDALQARMDAANDTSWARLLEQWSTQLAATLAIADIHELQVLGTSFDPQWSESIGTRARKPNVNANIPYEILEVVRRGFMSGDGTLIRKAQVITWKEGEDDVKR